MPSQEEVEKAEKKQKYLDLPYIASPIETETVALLKSLLSQIEVKFKALHDEKPAIKTDIQMEIKC